MIVVGIMTIPMVSSLSDDALHAVPQDLREAAYAVGSTKFEVTTRVVYPAALSGVIASYILAASRAVGETMAVTIAAGSTPNLTWNPAGVDPDDDGVHRAGLARRHASRDD